jgi:hypothetical protein
MKSTSKFDELKSLKIFLILKINSSNMQYLFEKNQATYIELK